MRKPLFVAVTLALLHAVATGQTPTPQATTPAPAASGSGLVLEDGTPVRLRISRNVSSADAQVGETVDFDVLDDVRVGRVIVIPKPPRSKAMVFRRAPGAGRHPRLPAAPMERFAGAAQSRAASDSRSSG